MQALVSLSVFVTIGIAVMVMNRNPEAGIWIIGFVMLLVFAVWSYVGYNAEKIADALGKKAKDALKGIDNGYKLKSPDEFDKRI